MSLWQKIILRFYNLQAASLPVTTRLWLTAHYKCDSEPTKNYYKNNKHTQKGFRDTGQGIYLLLSLDYLSWQLHFMHGLQPALHQLCWAQDKGGKARGEGACNSVLQIAAREKLQKVFGHWPSVQWGHCTSNQLPEHVVQISRKTDRLGGKNLKGKGQLLELGSWRTLVIPSSYTTEIHPSHTWDDISQPLPFFAIL